MLQFCIKMQHVLVHSPRYLPKARGTTHSHYILNKNKYRLAYFGMDLFETQCVIALNVKEYRQLFCCVHDAAKYRGFLDNKFNF